MTYLIGKSRQLRENGDEEGARFMFGQAWTILRRTHPEIAALVDEARACLAEITAEIHKAGGAFTVTESEDEVQVSIDV